MIRALKLKQRQNKKKETKSLLTTATRTTTRNVLKGELTTFKHYTNNQCDACARAQRERE